jgi:hypothetical protein
MKRKAHLHFGVPRREQLLHDSEGTFYTMQVIIARLPEFGNFLKKSWKFVAALH